MQKHDGCFRISSMCHALLTLLNFCRSLSVSSAADFEFLGLRIALEKSISGRDGRANHRLKLGGVAHIFGQLSLTLGKSFGEDCVLLVDVHAAASLALTSLQGALIVSQCVELIGKRLCANRRCADFSEALSTLFNVV